MPALVAKSYEGLEQLTEPYQVNGRMYVQVRMKNGSAKQVRAYSEAEYAKYNPEVKIIQPARSKRYILGFGEAGFIWLFKGQTYENIDWFRLSPCRYARPWGWFLASDKEMPSPLPANITPIKLEWEAVSKDDVMYPEDQVVQIVDKILYDPGTSTYVGEVGDHIDKMLTCDKAHVSTSAYGLSTFHVLHDEEGNIYTWSTNSRSLEVGETYHIRGTIKGHNTYRNKAQNELTRCRLVKE